MAQIASTLELKSRIGEHPEEGFNELLGNVAVLIYNVSLDLVVLLLTSEFQPLSRRVLSFRIIQSSSSLLCISSFRGISTLCNFFSKLHNLYRVQEHYTCNTLSHLMML